MITIIFCIKMVRPTTKSIYVIIAVTFSICVRGLFCLRWIIIRHKSWWLWKTRVQSCLRGNMGVVRIIRDLFISNLSFGRVLCLWEVILARGLKIVIKRSRAPAGIAGDFFEAGWFWPEVIFARNKWVYRSYQKFSLPSLVILFKAFQHLLLTIPQIIHNIVVRGRLGRRVSHFFSRWIK